jgi:hypothetical protein
LRELGERLQRLETKVDSLRRELEGEIDESRDDLRRTAELYDLVFKRLAGLSSSDSAAA